MTKTKTTGKERVWNYLNKGKGITPTMANTPRFKVVNLRATISDLKLNEKVKIKRLKTSSGETKYMLAKFANA